MPTPNKPASELQYSDLTEDEKAAVDAAVVAIQFARYHGDTRDGIDIALPVIVAANQIGDPLCFGVS